MGTSGVLAFVCSLGLEHSVLLFTYLPYPKCTGILGEHSYTRPGVYFKACVEAEVLLWLSLSQHWI